MPEPSPDPSPSWHDYPTTRAVPLTRVPLRGEPTGDASWGSSSSSGSRVPGSTTTEEVGSSSDARATQAVVSEPASWLPRHMGDFELLRLLGRGSFAEVHLARQVSLGRLVALKVSTNPGVEARTLASLEHAHIVQVYSETVDPNQGLRLLCMQYVPGTTLARIIGRLGEGGLAARSGRGLIDAIDALCTLPETFDPSALRDRQALERSDGVEAVCWLGTRLAEALAHAHGRGVLHRDIKPANILVNQYGRPFLADFNLAHDQGRVEGIAAETFGGTLAYMAPEHLDAFNPADPTPPEAVDARSDLYALGVVLFEALTGVRPFGPAGATPSGAGTLRAMADRRRAGPPSVRALRPEVPEVIERVLARALEPEPERRYRSAEEFALALEGARSLRGLHAQLPAPGPLTRAALRRPALWLVLLIFLPHLFGSVVNISYNALRIVSGLTEAQKAAFVRLLVGYNSVVYPLALWAAYRMIAPPLQTWWALRRGERVSEAEVAAARRRVLRWPLGTVVLSCLGWLPGAVVFPIGIDLMAGPIGVEVWARFFVSFWISGLIALTYAYFSVQYMSLRVFYPNLWLDATDVRATARRELAGLATRPHLFRWLAGLIPLVAAVLLVGLGPEAMSRSFRLLIAALILLGMKGFGLAVVLSGYLSRTLQVLVGVPGASRIEG